MNEMPVSNLVSYSSTAVITLLLFGCNSGEEESSATASSSDITNTFFTNLSGDCQQYLGNFFSSVNDIQRSLLFTGQVDISSSGTKCIVQSNAIPNHDFNDATASFATNVSEQSIGYEFTASPSAASSVTELSLGTSEAILLNGVKVDLLAAACYGVGDERTGCGQDQINNPWRYDPMSSLNGFGTDIHNAHVQPTGEYHYHGNPVAMFIQDCAGGEASPVIGFAADGFPVYGSCFTDSSTGQVRKAVSSYQLKSGARVDEGSYTAPVVGGNVASSNYDGQFRGDWEYTLALGDLDECNGMTVDGQYGYYVTDTFPWVLNCFKGTTDSSFSGYSAERSHGHSH
ncbi:YHYH protein [Vibrio coralliilyticus]|nr:YHYH protein [Vibrio coralliilyticus]NOI49248.1 YHYH protein [Vibrio coralliilyticus]NOI59671.1 YHYH protein [Vibrio coralliilyticus]PAT67642.1 YHYH protein [Vibrio coralliilyticus]QIJ85565.1 YHYH protein [Vibrio coralliilyticus OCN008]